MGLISKIGDKLSGSSSAEHDDRSQADHSQSGSHLRHPIQSHTGPTGTAVSHSGNASTSAADHSFTPTTKAGNEYAAPGSYPTESARDSHLSSEPLGTSGNHGLSSHGQTYPTGTGVSDTSNESRHNPASTRSELLTSSQTGQHDNLSSGAGNISSGSGIGNIGHSDQTGTGSTGHHDVSHASFDDSVPRSKHGGITNSSQTTNTPGPDFGATSGKENLHSIPTAGGQKVGTGVDEAETRYGAQPQHDSHSGSHHHGHDVRHHETQEHHPARDAALAATGGAGTGIATHQLEHRGQTGPAGSTLSGQGHQSTSHHHHHEGHGTRDAHLGAGALATGGALQHEADKHHASSHLPTSGSSGFDTRSYDPSAHGSASSRVPEQGFSSQHQTHHGARDTAVGAAAGIGAAGITSHELNRHTDHGVQHNHGSQYSNQPTSQASGLAHSQHSGALSAHHTHGSSQPFSSDLSSQPAGRDYDLYRGTSDKKDLTDPSNVSYMNRSTADPYNATTAAQNQPDSSFAGSNTTANFPHHSKPSHLGQDVGLAAGAGTLAGAGLSDSKQHSRYDSATQHNLPSAAATQTSDSSGVHTDKDLPPHISGFLHAQKVGGQYEAGYRAALAHLQQAKQLGI